MYPISVKIKTVRACFLMDLFPLIKIFYSTNYKNFIFLSLFRKMKKKLEMKRKNPACLELSLQTKTNNNSRNQMIIMLMFYKMSFVSSSCQLICRLRAAIDRLLSLKILMLKLEIQKFWEHFQPKSLTLQVIILKETSSF